MRDSGLPFTRPVIRATDRAGESVAEFHIDFDSLLWLADHRVQDMAILPGALYVELARSIEQGLCGRPPRIVRNLIFDRPIVLSGGQIVIRTAVHEHADGHVDYAFD